MMRKMIVATLLATMLAACGQAAQTPSTGSGATASPSSPAPSVATAAPEPTAVPAASVQPSAAPGGGTSVRPPDDLVAAAQRQLAAHLNLQPDQLVLQSANAQEWPDGALGCPAEGMLYPQVITEGFLLVFTDSSQNQSYEVHTAAGPAQLVLCQNGQPVDLSNASNATDAQPGATSPAGDVAQPVADLARAALAQELGIAVEDISVASVVQQDWSDSSLGCPKEGEAYLQVITPGYLVTLEAQGQRYEYHTDAGQRVVRC